MFCLEYQVLVHFIEYFLSERTQPKLTCTARSVHTIGPIPERHVLCAAGVREAFKIEILK